MPAKEENGDDGTRGDAVIVQLVSEDGVQVGNQIDIPKKTTIPELQALLNALLKNVRAYPA